MSLGTKTNTEHKDMGLVWMNFEAMKKRVQESDMN